MEGQVVDAATVSLLSYRLICLDHQKFGGGVFSIPASNFLQSRELDRIITICPNLALTLLAIKDWVVLKPQGKDGCKHVCSERG